MSEKAVKVTNKGMISIPSAISKKHNIIDGDYIIIREEEDGVIKLIPIESVESLRKQALTIEEFKTIFKKSREEDLELER